jgi:hypothetical protein
LLSLIPVGVILAIVRTLDDRSTGRAHVVRFLEFSQSAGPDRCPAAVIVCCRRRRRSVGEDFRRSHGRVLATIERPLEIDVTV